MQREEKDTLNPLSLIIADPEYHTFEEPVFNLSALIISLVAVLHAITTSKRSGKNRCEFHRAKE